MSDSNRRWLAAGLFVLLLLGAGWYALQSLGRQLNDVVAPPPETIAAATLEGVREQNRLSAFAARFVAVVTSEQSRMGLSARKTMILPGTVRYEVDLAKLGQKDVAWDAGAKRLSVTLPAVEITGPEVDLAQMREYDSGGILLALTDAEKRLDAANRARASSELLTQARQPAMIGMARDATRRAVERSFAMPLKAAGVDAVVTVRFADEPVPADGEQMDRSRSLEEIFGNHSR